MVTIKELQQSNNPKTILENEWVTIKRWDFLNELRKNSFFKDIEFNKKADHIFPWDQIIVKLWKIIIKREWEEITVWKIYFNETRDEIKKIKEQPKKQQSQTPTKQESQNKLEQTPAQQKSIQQKPTQQKLVEQKDIINISNPEIKKTFEQVLSKHNIAYITKQDLLRMSNNNYYVATSILMTHYNEQWRWKGTRGNVKNVVWRIEKWLGIHNWMVKSIWEFQIRYTAGNLSKEDIDTFFDNYKWYENLSFIKLMKSYDKTRLGELNEIFNKNWDLSNNERREFLEMKEVSRLMASIYITNRFNVTKKFFENTTKWKNKNNDFIILTNTLEWYHIWTTTKQNTTNQLLKVWEKMGILDKKWNFQLEIKENSKPSIEWAKWSNTKKRESEAFNWILDLLIENMKDPQVKENIKKSHSIDDKKYNQILKWLIISRNIWLIVYNENQIKENNKQLRYSIKELTGMYGINFKDFKIADYMNTNPKKAILLWNYWVNAYKALIK